MEEEKSITLGDWLALRDEMRAAELLLEAMQLSPANLATYWSLAAGLLALLQEIEAHLEEWRASGPGADERAAYLGMRRRLVTLLAASEEIGEPEAGS